MMTKINLETNAAYNFMAPSIEADANKTVEVPFPTQEVVSITADDDVTVKIQRACTVVVIGVEADIELIGELVATNLKVGDELLVIATAIDDDRSLAMSESLGGGTINLVQDLKTKLLLKYIGSGFALVANSASVGGEDGADGKSLLLLGEGVPAEGLGENGDYYIDTLTYDLYKKGAGVWSVIGNIKDAAGGGAIEPTFTELDISEGVVAVDVTSPELFATLTIAVADSIINFDPIGTAVNGNKLHLAIYNNTGDAKNLNFGTIGSNDTITIQPYQRLFISSVFQSGALFRVYSASDYNIII